MPSPGVQPERVEVELSVPGPARYELSLWGARLEVSLKLVAGKRDWLFDLAEPACWDLDHDEWSRRHLYEPGDTRLDDLMKRCAAYWSEATAHLLLLDLDGKVRSNQTS